MSLKSLVLCSDEKIVRVLRRVLSDLDIGIEHCTEPDGAIRKLTRERFEAVIIDCTDHAGPEELPPDPATKPRRRHMITRVCASFDICLLPCFMFARANAPSSFRPRLMKRERRRNTRTETVAVTITIVRVDLTSKSSPRTERGAWQFISR
jgi:hypothetical protein